MKKRYDRKAALNEEIHIGDWVKYLHGTRRIKRNWKYETSGPYRVIGRSRKNPYVYVIRMRGNLRKTVNRAKIELWKANIPAYVVR